MVVSGPLALTCRCACQIVEIDVRAKKPRYIPTPPMFPNPVGLAHTPLETYDDMVVIYSVHFRPTHPKTTGGGLLWWSPALWHSHADVRARLLRSMCVPNFFLLFFSVLGGINTWVQHLYSVPRDTGDKPQTGGNTSSGVFCVFFWYDVWSERRFLVVLGGPEAFGAHMPMCVPNPLGWGTWVALIYTVDFWHAHRPIEEAAHVHRACALGETRPGQWCVMCVTVRAPNPGRQALCAV